MNPANYSIIGAILLAVAIGVVLYFVYRKRAENQDTTLTDEELDLIHNNPERLAKIDYIVSLRDMLPGMQETQQALQSDIKELKQSLKQAKREHRAQDIQELKESIKRNQNALKGLNRTIKETQNTITKLTKETGFML